MSFGGGGIGDDAFLIGPILSWWEKHTDKRDAKRAARAEAKLEKKRPDSPQAESGPTP